MTPSPRWYVTLAVALELAACGPRPGQAQPPVGSDVEALISELTSEAPKVADGARRRLETMGESVVPILFEKLLVADWTLRPRLLEVLSAHGRDFAKKKLLAGNETEKVYAALVYELSIACAGEDHDYDSPEFKGMVAALLGAIKSDDKNLRAAAGAALVYDEESTVWFEHFHETIPVLISSFDTDLFIDRCFRGSPMDVVLILIGNNLTAFVGDRLIDVEREVFASTGVKIEPGDPQHRMRKVLSDKRSTIGAIRAEWETWWDEHSKLSAAQIGILMIERSLQALPPDPSTIGDSTTMKAEWCLKKWTGSYQFPREWVSWWENHKATFKGPIRDGN